MRPKTTGDTTMKLKPRAAGAYIVENAKNLKVNNAGIEKIADEVLKAILSKELHIDNFSQNNFHPKASPDPQYAVDWIFVCDTLNFCFWTPEDTPKWTVDGQTGYFALCAALNRAISEGVDITKPAVYSQITEEQLKKIFRGDDGTTMIPMLKERVECLHQAGTILLNKYNGTFMNCLKKADHSAKKLVDLVVSEFPSFADEALYKGQVVCMYKRVQILVGDIWACFRGEGEGEFNDIAEITMFADYRVPQVLAHFGALEYGRGLLAVLTSNILLRNGSEEEVEIRGASIHITEKVRDRVLERLAREHPDVNTKFVTAILIDHFLWNYRREHAQQLEHIPFHKTISIFY